MRRFLTIIAGILAVVLIGVTIFAVVTVRKSFPETDGEVDLSGIADTVKIKRDEQGVPQIYAKNSQDLFFGQGYAHAQDRFFEMDFRRHVTSGRLTELFGKSALDTDKFVRTLGWRRVAEQEVADLDAKTLRLLRAYAKGVNAYIDGKSGSELSLEYSVLSLTGPDYRPAPWGPADSVAWIKAMAWDLASNMDDEISRVLIADKVGQKKAEQLYPAYPFDINDPIVKKGTIEDGKFDQDAQPAQRSTGPLSARTAVAALKTAGSAAAKLPTLLGTGDGIGSNSWVVSGEKSATGKPILANDPHLAPSMPGIWYQVGLHCTTVSAQCPYEVSGFSFSGMPGVVVGHNKDVAWGVTTMYADVADLYLERVTGDTYEYDGKQLPLTKREEKFTIAGADNPVSITVRSTKHGPLLSDLDEKIDDVAKVDHSARLGKAGKPGGIANAVALRWTALEPQGTIRAIFALGTVKNWDDFRAAAKMFTVPSQNLIYADTSGNIGYQSPGIIPVRAKGDGRWPVPGWDPAYEWKGTIPFDELPSVYNPAEGYIVTANNAVINPSGYGQRLGADTAPGYRSQRIQDLLKKKDKLTVNDMTRMQMDTYSANAAQLVPMLLDIPLKSKYYRQGQDTLRGWDFMQEPDSGAAAYFNAVWRNILRRTFHDELPKAQWPDGGERWFNVMRTMLVHPNSSWWDDTATPSQTESRDEALAQAMRDARDDMTRLQSRDPQKWSWGQFHTLTLENQTLGTSGIGAIEAIFNRGPYKTGGGNGIINANSWNAVEGYQVTAVPSMRMTVDLANLDKSRWIQLTGNSGHAYHDNYVDQTELWAEGKTLPWAFSASAVDKATKGTLTLRPVGAKRNSSQEPRIVE